MSAQTTPLSNQSSFRAQDVGRQVLTLKRQGPKEANSALHTPPNKEPQDYPPMLISTWFWMMRSGPSEDVKSTGEARLLKAFGSLKVAEEYLRNFPEYCR